VRSWFPAVTGGHGDHVSASISTFRDGMASLAAGRLDRVGPVVSRRARGAEGTRWTIRVDPGTARAGQGWCPGTRGRAAGATHHGTPVDAGYPSCSDRARSGTIGQREAAACGGRGCSWSWLDPAFPSRGWRSFVTLGDRAGGEAMRGAWSDGSNAGSHPEDPKNLPRDQRPATSDPRAPWISSSVLTWISRIYLVGKIYTS